MPEVTLTPAKKGETGTWRLSLGDDQSRLFDPQGNLVTEFAKAAAEQKILLPSFSENRKNISIWVSNDKIILFQPDKEALAAIKGYFNSALAGAGPEAIAVLKRSGYRNLAIGVIATIAGVGLTVGSMMFPTKDANGQEKSVITYGLVIFGLIQTGRGVMALMRAGKIQST